MQNYPVKAKGYLSAKKESEIIFVTTDEICFNRKFGSTVVLMVACLSPDQEVEG